MTVGRQAGRQADDEQTNGVNCKQANDPEGNDDAKYRTTCLDRTGPNGTERTEIFGLRTKPNRKFLG